MILFGNINYFGFLSIIIVSVLASILVILIIFKVGYVKTKWAEIGQKRRYCDSFCDPHKFSNIFFQITGYSSRVKNIEESIFPAIMEFVDEEFKHLARILKQIYIKEYAKFYKETEQYIQNLEIFRSFQVLAENIMDYNKSLCKSSLKKEVEYLHKLTQEQFEDFKQKKILQVQEIVMESIPRPILATGEFFGILMENFQKAFFPELTKMIYNTYTEARRIKIAKEREKEQVRNEIETMITDFTGVDAKKLNILG